MLKGLFFGTLLTAGASASVIRQEIISEVQSCDVEPQGLLNDLNIVPLLDIARTGLIPPEVEEGLLAALGPRFLNVFLEDAKAEAHTKGGQCANTCAGTVIKLAPCIAKALITKQPRALLSCGFTKKIICDCAKCLPDKIKVFVNVLCKDSSLPAEAVDEETMSYPDYVQYSTRAPYLQAFRGDLKKTAVEEARALYKGAATTSMPPYTQDIFGFCPGIECSGQCCVGICVFDKCLGTTL